MLEWLGFTFVISLGLCGFAFCTLINGFDSSPALETIITIIFWLFLVIAIVSLVLCLVGEFVVAPLMNTEDKTVVQANVTHMFVDDSEHLASYKLSAILDDGTPVIVKISNSEYATISVGDNIKLTKNTTTYPNWLKETIITYSY